jgi:hypothetical protein
MQRWLGLHSEIDDNIDEDFVLTFIKKLETLVFDIVQKEYETELKNYPIQEIEKDMALLKKESSKQLKILSKQGSVKMGSLMSKVNLRKKKEKD